MHVPILNLLKLVREPQDLPLGGLRLRLTLGLVLKGRVEQGAAARRFMHQQELDAYGRQYVWDVVQRDLVLKDVQRHGFEMCLPCPSIFVGFVLAFFSHSTCLKMN